MTSHVRGRSLAFLRRVGLLAGLLTVIAGILAMHVVTGTHYMSPAFAGPGMDVPAAGVVEQAVPTQVPASAHTGHAAAPNAVTGMVSTPAPSCAGSGPCTAMSAMDAVCVPSPATTVLAAPPPGSTPFAAQDLAVASSPAAGSSYLPGSPSPGDLGISRT
ncbi:hypothetical protein PV761_23050 [Arthrobacter sp. CC3]|uniref:hypothetical protein n=1 Tax=Arthrobacter sp. CC3 TaxID=3029185 RepID=UPI00326713A6